MPSECPRMYRLTQATLLLSLCFLAPLSGVMAQGTAAKPPALFTQDGSRIAAVVNGDIVSDGDIGQERKCSAGCRGVIGFA